MNIRSYIDSDRHFCLGSGIVFLFLLVIYILALRFDWFYFYPRIDIFMHVVGGFLSGLIALSIYPKNIGPFQKLIWVTFLVLIAGIGVEVIEWAFDRFGHFSFLLQPSMIDTYTDILHDMIGGMMAFFVGYWKGRL